MASNRAAALIAEFERLKFLVYVSIWVLVLALVALVVALWFIIRRTRVSQNLVMTVLPTQA